MIKDLSELLATAVDAFSKHPFATISTILIGVLLYLGYNTLDRIETIVIPPSLEAARFHEQLSASEQINTSLHNLNTDLKGHSVVLRQFHNGKHDLTGIPFTKSTVTFYDAQDDSLLEADEPLSSMSTSLSRIWKRIDEPKCIVLDSPVDKTTKYYMSRNELNFIIICPMVNLLKYPVGTITVGLKTLPEGSVEKVHDVATQVTGYLEGKK